MTAAGQMCLAYGITTAERFEQFHDENPIVYVTLVRLAREWVKATGRHKVGIGALRERARWEIVMATNDPDFKNQQQLHAVLRPAHHGPLRRPGRHVRPPRIRSGRLDQHLPAGSNNRMTSGYFEKQLLSVVSDIRDVFNHISGRGTSPGDPVQRFVPWDEFGNGGCGETA